MSTVEKLLDLHLCRRRVIEQGYRSLPADRFVDANDPDGHVQSWTQCFPEFPQAPVVFLEDSNECLATLFPDRTYPNISII